MDLDSYFEMNESIMNFCNPHLQVKEEERNFLCFSYPINPEMISYPNISECLATLLKLDIKQVEWVITSSPLEMMRMVDKAKRVIRRERAKLRTRIQKQQFFDQPLADIQPQDDVKQEYVAAETETVRSEKKKRGKRSPKIQYVSDTQSTSDEQNQKKMVQMIRNRISAQISRDKKKEYLQGLEQNAKFHEEQNVYLKKQLQQCQQKLVQAEEESKQLRQVLRKLQCQIIGIDHYKSKKIHKNTQDHIVANDLVKVIDSFLKISNVNTVNNLLEQARNQVKNHLEPNIQ